MMQQQQMQQQQMLQQQMLQRQMMQRQMMQQQMMSWAQCGLSHLRCQGFRRSATPPSTVASREVMQGRPNNE